MIWAQSLLGFDVQEGVVFIIKIIATIGGAVVGWFVCDPLTRVAYRLSFKAPTPSVWLFCGKAIGAACLAAAVFILMPEGGGGGGPGPGGLPGKGKDKGGDKTELAKDAKADPKNDKAESKDKSDQKLEPVEIEIISDKLYNKVLEENARKCWYVIKQKPYTHDELDDYLKASAGKIEVTPVLTRDSIQLGRTELPELTRKYKIKTLQYKTP